MSGRARIGSNAAGGGECRIDPAYRGGRGIHLTGAEDYGAGGTGAPGRAPAPSLSARSPGPTARLLAGAARASQGRRTPVKWITRRGEFDIRARVGLGAPLIDAVNAGSTRREYIGTQPCPGREPRAAREP